MLHKLARHLGSSAAVAAEEPTCWEYGGDVGRSFFEFGSLEWCRLCAQHGCKLLEAAAARGDLDLAAQPNWGFSEEYCQCPDRLASAFADGRSVYWFSVVDGVVTEASAPPLMAVC